jgi:hypothetical protein
MYPARKLICAYATTLDPEDDSSPSERDEGTNPCKKGKAERQQEEMPKSLFQVKIPYQEKKIIVKLPPVFPAPWLSQTPESNFSW